MMINRTQTKTDSDTIHCLVNPEPITVKGIKTFHPAFFHIYSGKKGVIYSFRAVEEKKTEDAQHGFLFRCASPF